MKARFRLLICLTGLGAVFCAASTAFELPAGPAHAQARAATVQVLVAPDRPDWTYRPGETARFNVSVSADGQSLVGVTVRYSVGLEMLPAEEKSAVLPAGGLVIDGGTLREPGFLCCHVTVSVAGKTYRSLATAGFSPEKIQPTQTDPADFDTFWQTAKDELAKIPLDVRRTLLPDAWIAETLGLR